MDDLKLSLESLLSAEPEAPDDLELIVGRGRRARRRRTAVTTVAGGAGAAALTASVVVPISLARGPGGDPAHAGAAHPGHPPKAGVSIRKQCELVRSTMNPAASGSLTRLDAGNALSFAETRLPASKPGTYYEIRVTRHGQRTLVTYCLSSHHGIGDAAPGAPSRTRSTSPTTPTYTYTESPQEISARLGTHLADRVQAFGLTVNYTRPFSQETSTLEAGHPDYFGGNVDVQETSGYGDIGVQVTHRSTQQTPLTGPCDSSGPSQCQQTTLADGSVLRTERVQAGAHDLILTADLARPDGVLVQAQESNYPFGPDAGTEAHGTEPLTLDQLTALAEDPHFTF